MESAWGLGDKEEMVVMMLARDLGGRWHVIWGWWMDLAKLIRSKNLNPSMS